MTTTEFTDGLVEAMYEANEDVKTQTFEDAGVLTNDTGVVVKVDGNEFYVTVQKR